MRVQVERGRVEGARCERGGVLLTPTHPRATFSLTYSLIYSLQLREFRVYSSLQQHPTLPTLPTLPSTHSPTHSPTHTGYIGRVDE